MTRNFKLLSYVFLACLLMLGQTAFSQTKKKSGDSSASNITADNVIADKSQHKNWKNGKSAYPSRPKDMWELGINVGHLYTSGDVRPEFGWGVGLSARKSLGYVVSLRLHTLYGQMAGINDQISGLSAGRNARLSDLGYGSSSRYFYNFKSTYAEASLQGIFTINNLKFHKKRNKWDLFLIAGAGAQYVNTKLNALDASDNIYDFEPILANNSQETREGRSAIISAQKELLDDTYETLNEKSRSGMLVGDNGRLNPMVNAGVGIGYKINKRVTLALESVLTFSGDDLIDGKRWAEQGDLSSAADAVHYTSLRVNIHLGSFKKRVEPLWWVNPLDAAYQDIADIKKLDIESMMDDADGDGVPDRLDKEANSPADCPVDTRGVTLDSDGDGIPDCEDKEPYSAPGYPVDPSGVAQVPQYTTEDDVIKLVDDRMPSPEELNGKGIADWFLPMIHFDLNKYHIKPEFYGQLHHIATIMKKYPELRVVVEGHTDPRNTPDYNQALAYKRSNAAISYIVSTYNVDQSRFVLQYAGETVPLVDAKSTSSYEKEKQQYMNRRVEFRVATPEDASMPQPAVENFDRVGADTPGSSKKGKKYSGNPGSGY